jgi:hypothetical protein
MVISGDVGHVSHLVCNFLLRILPLSSRSTAAFNTKPSSQSYAEQLHVSISNNPEYHFGVSYKAVWLNEAPQQAKKAMTLQKVEKQRH